MEFRTANSIAFYALLFPTRDQRPLAPQDDEAAALLFVIAPTATPSLLPTYPPMSAPSSGPLATNWRKWKTLKLPWRRRWLAGTVLHFPHSKRRHAAKAPSQAKISPATHTGTSSPVVPPLMRAVSSKITPTYPIPTSIYPQCGTNGSDTLAPLHPPYKNSKQTSSARFNSNSALN